MARAQCGNFHTQENNPLSKADAMAGPMLLHRVPDLPLTVVMALST